MRASITEKPKPSDPKFIPSGNQLFLGIIFAGSGTLWMGPYPWCSQDFRYGNRLVTPRRKNWYINYSLAESRGWSRRDCHKNRPPSQKHSSLYWHFSVRLFTDVIIVYRLITNQQSQSHFKTIKFFIPSNTIIYTSCLNFKYRNYNSRRIGKRHPKKNIRLEDDD